MIYIKQPENVPMNMQSIWLNSKLPQAIKKVLFNHTEQFSDIAPRYTCFAPGGGREVCGQRGV